MGKGRHLCLHGQRQRFRGQTRISQEELPQNAVSPHTLGDTLTQISTLVALGKLSYDFPSALLQGLEKHRGPDILRERERAPQDDLRRYQGV